MPSLVRRAAGLALGILLGACARSAARPSGPPAGDVPVRSDDRPSAPAFAAPPVPIAPSPPTWDVASPATPADPARPASPALEGRPDEGPTPVLRPAVPAAPLRGADAPPRPTAPTSAHPGAPAASGHATPPTSTAPTPTAPTARRSVPAPYPSTFAPFVARLRADATSGHDPDLAGFADLLETIERVGLDASPQTSIARVPELEASTRAPFGRGTGWSTITTWLEQGGDADAIRAVYLDFDRVPEWVGKPGTRALGRTPEGVLGETDAVRRALAFEYGARWRFLARPLDRGNARLIASRMVPTAQTKHMLATHGIVIAFPEGAAVRVVEVATTCVDYEVPPLLKDLALSAALKEMYARNAGLRGHWKEYVGESSR